MDNTCSCIKYWVTSFEDLLESLPLDTDLKKEIIERFKQLKEDGNHLSYELSKSRMEIDRMKSTIVRLAMMLSDN